MASESSLKRYLLLFRFGFRTIRTDDFYAYKDYHNVKEKINDLCDAVIGITATQVFVSRMYDTLAYVVISEHSPTFLKEAILAPDNIAAKFKRYPSMKIPTLINRDDMFMLMELGDTGDGFNCASNTCQDPIALLQTN